MAKKDLSSLDRTIMQPLSRDIDDAFSDGIDCNIKIMGGNALRLYASDDTQYNALYTDTDGSLVIPTTTSATYNDDTALYFGTDSDVGFNWISATPYFYLSCLADGTELRIGNGTLDFDVTWYAGSNTVVFNEGNSDVTFNGVDLSLEDLDHLYLGDSNDVDISYDSANLVILPAADADGMVFGDNTHGWTVTIYGGSTSQSIVLTGASTNTLVFDDIDVQLGDDDILSFGDTASPGDVYMRWDNTDFDILADADGTIINFGNGTNDFDIYWHAGSDTVVFDEGAAKVTFTGVDLYLGDSDSIYLGAGSDVDIRWDGTDLDILPVLDGSDMKFGDTTHAWDITWYGEDANYTVVLSSTGNSITLNAVDLSLEDDDHLYLGDSDDVDMYFNGANDFYILPGTDLDNIYLGSTAGDKSWDIIWTGAGAANTVDFGVAANTITLTSVDLTLVTSDITYSDPTTNAASTGVLLTTASRRHQFLSATGTGTICVSLPAVATAAGIEFNVYNTSSTGTITIYDASTGGTYVATCASKASAQIMSDGTSWHAIMGAATT